MFIAKLSKIKIWQANESILLSEQNACDVHIPIPICTSHRHGIL